MKEDLREAGWWSASHLYLIINLNPVKIRPGERQQSIIAIQAVAPTVAAVPGMVSSQEQIQISSGMSVWHSGTRGACSSTRTADSLGTSTTLAQGYVNALALGIRWPPETWTAWIPMTSCSLDHLSKKRLMILRLLERTNSRKWKKKYQ